MRQHDRMRLGMRKVEQAAERVTELVMQRHANGAEANAGEEGAVLRIRAGLAVFRAGGDARQCSAERGNALLGKRPDDRVGARQVAGAEAA